ncbi:tRNA (adenosine(37)-N6)-threonylcarbamoyltransferase complex ATPase subunit type 1 TsaE [Patescibacteria group bacterium]|jgi:tRNA threonylcarbamoyladenosine biosynthesis protein TsaE|nr:tRNA (adenosine(37)-N6)-threonylcarbamoyltransferase complex ATPase subunit type 1 TsaE [Patescibacteria group bacterium]
MQEFISNNLADTEAIAQNLLSNLADKNILALSGNLGAGKTTFVKFLASALGVKENITSPTFVLLKVYEIEKQVYKKFVHVDCYRLDGDEDLADVGLQDYVFDKENLVLIEWADKISNLPQDKVLNIKIEILGETSRKFIIS